MKYVWILKYTCCPDVIAYSNKAKAIKKATEVSEGYDSNVITDYGTFWECVSTETADLLITIYRLDVN